MGVVLAYISFKPSSNTEQAAAIKAMQDCISDIRKWMRADRLKLNDDKTEFIIIGTRQQLTKVSVESLCVGAETISPSDEVKNLGCWFDTQLKMDLHINKSCRAALFHLFNIRRIRKFLSHDTVQMFSRFDHITPALHKLHWLPVRYRIDFKILLITYKAIHGQSPEYITELIKFKEESRYNLRSSKELLLKRPTIRSLATLGDRAFEVAAPKLWNAL